jgi:hypothetical protein
MKPNRLSRKRITGQVRGNQRVMLRMVASFAFALFALARIVEVLIATL